jgi:hypothetical protein
MASFTISTQDAKAVRGINPSNEGGEDRTTRMQDYFLKSENQTIYSVGKLLAYPADEHGTTGAELIAQGGSVEIESLEVNGMTLPLSSGFALSLDNLKVWGCLACGSAQGSHRYPSQKVNVNLLAANDFYYNPSTQELFTISPTCWGKYIKALGNAKHFVTVPSPAGHTPKKGKK